MKRAISIFMVVGFIWWSLPFGTLHAHPKATEGFFDLSTWHFETEGTTQLAGEWEFYWHQLIDPSDFAVPEAPTPSGWINVPGAWNAYTVDDKTLPAMGYATYRLQLRHEANQPLALYIPFQQTAYRLWVGQTLVASNGSVTTNAADAKPQYKPTIVRFTPTEPNVDIVFQIANYSHRVGGMWNAPLLGLENQLDQQLTQRLLLAVLLVGGFLFLALYHMSRFALRRSEKSSVLLGLLGLFMATRTALMGDIPIAWIFSNIPWEWQIRVEYAAGFGAFAVFALFLRFLFPLDVSRLVSRIAGTVGAASALLALSTPVLISSQAIPFLLLFMSAFLVYFIYIAVRAFMRKRPGGLITLIGVGFLMVTVLLDFLYYNRYYGRTHWMPFGFFVFVMVLTLIEARQYATALRQKELLVNELQGSRRLLASLEDRQRQEVAEFLHSRVQTRLALLSYQAAKAIRLIEQDRQRAVELLKAIRQDLVDVQENDIRRASHQLHPAIVASGLIPAIQALAEQYVDVLDVSVSTDEKITAMDRAAALGTEGENNRHAIGHSNRLTVYRIVEEWLANIHKHASASQVDITLGITKQDELLVSLTDDGKGFDPQKVRAGLGLRIIEARMLQEGGTLHIETSPNQGTTITARLPLATSAQTTQGYPCISG